MNNIDKIGYWISANVWLILWFIDNWIYKPDASWFSIIIIFGVYIFMICKAREIK